MPELSFDAAPSSASFGELQLAVSRDGALLADGERSWLEARVAAAPADLAAAVTVWTGDIAPATDGCRHPDAQPAVLGEVRVVGEGLVFEPRFPWVTGLDYTACVDSHALWAVLHRSGAGGDRWQRLVFSLPAPEAAGPQVVAVWPDLEEVPANLLRFYIHFSEPMHRRGVAKDVRLLDAAGRPIVEPFVDIPDGLWDPDGRRLTVFLHPGRIKRGVGPREALGPVLREGERVVLAVDAGLETARGAPLGETFRVSYRVGAPDRAVPDPDQWIVHRPGEHDKRLRLEFDEPLDRAQLATAIKVLHDGTAVPGRGEVEAEGRIWSFTPTEPWLPGGYQIEVGRTLEDLAGNTMDRLFDVATAGEPGPSGSGVVEPSLPRGQALRLEFAVTVADR